MRASAFVFAVLFVSCAVAQNDPAKNNKDWTIQNSIAWDTLRNLALNIPNQQCKQDILDTLDEANLLLNDGGFSDDFFAHMGEVLRVTGEDPTASDFRARLVDTKSDFQTSKRGFVPHPANPDGSKPIIRGVAPPKMQAHRVPS